jgi:hypothetical protein
MEENIRDSGHKIRCMEKVFILGKMEENMKVNINMIKSMVLVFIHGLMEENMKEIGRTD